MKAIKKINSSTGIRLFVSGVIGIAAGILASQLTVGNAAILIGWDAAVITFVLWIWLITWPMDHKRTSLFALREDPSRVGADIILILSSLASLGAVGFALFEAHNGETSQMFILTFIGILSVVLSWILVHTIYTLRYARLYYSTDIEGTVDFKKDHKPAYSDFFYLAFTIGMTFQVADTDLVGTEFRKTVLRHAILSYIFGAVIVGVTVNLIASLGK